MGGRVGAMGRGRAMDRGLGSGFWVHIHHHLLTFSGVPVIRYTVCLTVGKYQDRNSTVHGIWSAVFVLNA